MRKTYKREAAAAALLWLGVQGVLAIWLNSEMAFRVMEIAIAPIFLFAGGAFGLDAYAKQIVKKQQEQDLEG